MTSYKKIRFLKIYIGCAVLAIILVIFSLLSKRMPNIVDDVSEIHFSKESGFYAEEFDLTISSATGKIYYTLDGSTPTCDSFLYEGPIHIEDASSNQNIYSMRTDVSTGFESDLINQYSTNDPEYKVPDYLVDKCTIVKAVIYYGENRYSKIKCASYFVGYNNKEGYEDINVVSIVTDPENLFAYEDGIYVTGKSFDDYKIETLGEKTPYWWWWTSNYSRENATEQVASCQFFCNKELVLSQTCGIRIHGGGSRGKNPKSLNIYAREEYGGNGNFQYNFFGNDYYPSVVTLFQGGDDDMTKCKDYIMNHLTADLDISTMKFVPYVLFLDGEYWGVYWITEKYDENYINYYYNVLQDNVVIIKDGKVEEGLDSDIELYNELMEFGKSADFNNPENVEKLCNMIDIDSFLDYYASLSYVARCSDWPNGNTALWRSRKIGNGQYNDGRWRWMLFDVNSGGIAEKYVDYNSIENLETNDFLANILTCREIRSQLVERILYLEGTIFSDNSVANVFEDFHHIMDIPMELNHKRFFGENTYYKYWDNVRDVELFFEDRHKYINIFISEFLQE